MRCKKHKRYKAKLRPRCDCVDCWRIFLKQTATYNHVCQELERRTPSEGMTMIAEFDPGTNEEREIRHMLMDYKRKFDEDCMRIWKALADDIKSGYFENSYPTLEEQVAAVKLITERWQKEDNGKAN